MADLGSDPHQEESRQQAEERWEQSRQQEGRMEYGIPLAPSRGADETIPEEGPAFTGAGGYKKRSTVGHEVYDFEVEQRDTSGNALCPQHHTPMEPKGGIHRFHCLTQPG